MVERVVTIRRFSSSFEYHQAKGFLESEGIYVFPDSDNTVTAVPWYANAIGGICLKVKKGEAEKALSILGPEPQPEINEEADKRKYKALKQGAVLAFFFALVLVCISLFKEFSIRSAVELGLVSLLTMFFLLVSVLQLSK